MACDGCIEYIDLPYLGVSRVINLFLDRRDEYEFPLIRQTERHYLIADIGVFVNCTLERRAASYAILGRSSDVGCIWYDIEFIRNFPAQ